ncbi:class I SAM-dependent methyltransferase [Candidatus Peregrinibacteria bacterium]|jgi:ubiquinone/menaquinone biosynthesis C-methylase UbiE|nr:class I SAM-dependent methyltransferase [Candidatus Peregrinibacteria bacterium]MBT3598989.1 class I SAM-dependent methyltransferase [Candidatus Peregrinibacteria bacterium]MBT4366979.1 class I SAM-dependent methyltransferase [Candidatus Peregrinibacteria bacterium]MBT4585485.1 class I SAM-dependent methyltransferase [Candidatus Peregrinibacteria bacterium]MBT6731300.1 class I SAM-dependent methyltransferase [Candidatus Peregrinibacteria bacterium]
MSDYLKTCQSYFWTDVFNQEFEYIVNKLGDNKNVLSVGCGPAIIEKKLMEAGFLVTGLDVSKEAIAGSPDDLRTIIGSAEDMDIEDSKFDAVIFVASLQFITDYKKAISEASRVLKDRGLILVMLLNPESEFYNENIKDPDSYMRKTKHFDNSSIYNEISKYFESSAEYFLGIKDSKTFTSSDPKLASLYVINGSKRN